MIEENVKLSIGNLNKDQAALIREELSLLTAENRPETRLLTTVDLRLWDLSGLGPLPEAFPSGALRIEASSSEKPVAFEARCAWELSVQSFQIIRAGENIFWIAGGGPEGVLYGFYAFLKRATGVRWYSPAEEDKVFSEPHSDIETLSRPSLPYRGLGVSGTLFKNSHAFVMDTIRWMARNQLNLLNLNAAEWVGNPMRRQITNETKRCGIRIAAGRHAISYFLPNEKLSECPELFGLRDGKRCLTAPVFSPDVRGGRIRSRPIQPCYSNPETREYFAEAVADFLDRHPEVDIFSLWPKDGSNNWCQCPQCLETTPYEMLYTLALDILELNSTEVVEVLCYANTLNPPRRKLPASDRTYTLFCPYLRRHERRFFDPDFAPSSLTVGTNYPAPEPSNPSDDREYGVLLDRWLPHLKAAGSQLGVFAYYQLVFHDETGASDRSRFLYHPEPELVEAEIEHYWENGMKVFQDCSPPFPGYWPDARFYAYLPSLLWKPDLNTEPVIKEYYHAALGGKAQQVIEILNTLAACIKDRDNPGISGDIEKRARTILSEVPGKRGSRYLLWLDYIMMADKVRLMKLDGRLNKAAEMEEKIISFFENHRAELDQHINIEWMQRYSRTAIDYLSHMKSSQK